MKVILILKYKERKGSFAPGIEKKWRKAVL